MMKMVSIPRALGALVGLTCLLPPPMVQADQTKPSHKDSSHTAAKHKRKPTLHRTVSEGVQTASVRKSDVSYPDAYLTAVHKVRLAKIHKAQLAAGHTTKRDEKDEEKEEEEREHEGKNPRGVTGGEYFMWKLRAYPNNFIDPSAFDRAVAQRSRLPAAHIGYAGGSQGGISVQALFPSANWSFVGPVNWYPTSQRAYYGVESMNGHVESIAVDPTNRLILYVAAQSGGVFKSTDGGVTWKPQSNNWSYLRTTWVAIDPKNHLTVYAGTGTSPVGTGTAIGLMKTTDGGMTWTNIGANKDGNGNYLYFAGTNVNRVLIDPTNSSSVTVLTGEAKEVKGGGTEHPANANLWNSTDGGVTWSKKVGDFTTADGTGTLIDHGSWVDGIVTKSGVYLAVGTAPDGAAVNNLLYRSTDQGKNWAQVPNAPIDPASTIFTKGARLAASPVNPNTVYLLYAYDDHATLFKTANGGLNWTDITASTGLNSGFLTSPNNELDQVPYDYYLGCSSRKVNNVAIDVLYMGLKSVYQQVQTAGNTTWKNVGNSYGELADFHSDQHCIAFDPTNPDRGFFGSDGGIYQFYSNPTTNATTFLSLNDGLQMTQFYNTAYHPTDSTIMIGGSQDNGTAASLGDLNSWQMPTGGDAFSVLINPLNPQTMYSTYTNGSTSRTDDMYTSGRYDITPNLTSTGVGSVAFVTPLAMDPTNPNFVYTAGQKLGRYDATKPVATAWTYFPTVLTSDQVSTLAVSPADGKRIFVASAIGELFTTANGGTTWVTLKAGNANDTLPNVNVGAILPDPANAKAVLIGLSGVNVPGHLYYCADVTAANPTWTSLSGANATALPDASLNAIAIDPADARILYVGTDVGVFQSPDRGLTWSNATAPLGLPNVIITDLKAMPLQGYLYGATFGRGIFRIRIRNNDPVAGLLFNPERVNGGQPITGTVLLGANAPAGGTSVTLTSDTPGVASVTSPLVVPQGQNQANFTITTKTVGFTTPVKITASIPGSGAGFSKSGTITVLSGTVLPSLSGIDYVDYPGGFTFGIDGSFSTQVQVTLSKAAPSPITINLTTTDPIGVTIPKTVTIPTGATTAQFTATFNPVSAPETVTITAQLGSFKKTTGPVTRN